MAKKKEGSRSGSSAKPIRNIFQKRGAGRAPSTDSNPDIKDGSAESINEKRAEQKSPEVEHADKGLSEYETVIDKIVAEVEEKESVDLTELSKRFNIPYARLEEWGRILDKDGLLELEYPMVGDVMLRKKGYMALHKKKGGTEKKGKEPKRAEDIAGKDGHKEDKEPLKEDKKEEEHKAEAHHEAGKKDGPHEEGHKKMSKRKFRLIMVGLVIFIIALVGVLIYSLSKGGLIQLV